MVLNMQASVSVRVSNVCCAILLFVILGLVVLVYLPGLKGGFLFDDFPNLEDLAFYGGVVDFETFKNFVFNGFSGPLGRPISMASFLLDDNKWPSNPEWFKTTNLKVHLLTGLVLCWATLNLLRLYKFGGNDGLLIWIALLSSAIWMLHPYMVSTTLYVVQRMAQLATLFVLAGIAGYLHGRLLLIKGSISKGYLWMSLSLIGGTGLAVFSKENGILLPLLVLTIEFCLPKSTVSLGLIWKAFFLWGPSLLVFCILAKEINLSPDAWPNRPFTQIERLLTEARILWEYLYHLYIPRIEGRGLFQDGYHFSHSLLSPSTTLVAWLGWVGVIAVSIKYRYRFPLACLGILFYLVSHLIESTVLGLELYFEHRNYLASVFLFLPVSMLALYLKRRFSLGLSVFFVVLLITVLSFLTWERSKLWSNSENLQLYWAVSTPESPRALNVIGSAMLKKGDVGGALVFMKNATESHPQSSFLNVSFLLMKMHAESAQLADFELSASKIRGQSFDVQAVVGIRRLADMSVELKDDGYLNGVMLVLNSAESNVNFTKVYTFRKLLPYLKGRIYLALNDVDKAYLEFKKALPMYSETDASFGMVAEMASADRPVEALLLLKQAEVIFKMQPDTTLRRSRDIYEAEFLRMYSVLKNDLASKGVSVVEEKTTRGKNDQHNNTGQE